MRRSLTYSGIFALQRNGERVQLRCHQTASDRWIFFHELPGRGFFFRLEYCYAECLVARFRCAPGQDQLASFDRLLESNKVALQGLLVFLGPIRVRMQPRHETQHIDELLWLFGLGFLRWQRLNEHQDTSHRDKNIKQGKLHLDTIYQMESDWTSEMNRSGDFGFPVFLVS